MIGSEGMEFAVVNIGFDLQIYRQILEKFFGSLILRSNLILKPR